MFSHGDPQQSFLLCIRARLHSCRKGPEESGALVPAKFSIGISADFTVAAAKEAAEKVGRRMKMRPSAAKAAPVFNRLCTG